MQLRSDLKAAVAQERVASATPVIQASLRGKLLRLAVAADPASRSRGLSDGLRGLDGMLFVFPRPQQAAFWMTGVRDSLSIAFLDDEGYIVHMEDMRAHSTQLHMSPVPVRYALELPLGRFRELGAGRGCFVRFQLPENLNVH